VPAGKAAVSARRAGFPADRPAVSGAERRRCRFTSLFSFEAMPTRRLQEDLEMPGKKHGNVKNPKMYEGLRRKGMSKTRAAKISNSGRSAARKGGKKAGRKKK
jgi:hypothetical protein